MPSPRWYDLSVAGVEPLPSDPTTGCHSPTLNVEDRNFPRYSAPTPEWTYRKHNACTNTNMNPQDGSTVLNG